MSSGLSSDHGLPGVSLLERKAHKDFIDLRAHTVYGRDVIQNRVLSYIAQGENRVGFLFRDSHRIAGVALGLQVVKRNLVSYLAEDQHRILMLEGDAGAGKSALIALCAQKAFGFFPHLKIFYHFVGAAPGSTDLVRLLRRMWIELSPDQPLPPTEDGLIRNISDLLARAGREGGVVIFVDALNQLDADAEQAQFRWLPMPLPPGVRCVVSVIGGTSCQKLMCERSPPPGRVVVGPLDHDAREQLVRSVMSQHPKVVTREEVQQLLSKPGSSNALWLVSACEELKITMEGCRVEDSVGERIRSFDNELLGLLEQRLLRVQQQGEETLLIAAFCFLECSRHGLLEDELRALLADERRCQFVESGESECPELHEDFAESCTALSASELKGQLHESARAAVQEQTLDTLRSQSLSESASPLLVDAPVVSKQVANKLLSPERWQTILHCLEPFLRPCGERRQSFLDFFHRAVSKAVRRRYLQDGRRYSFWHGRLADFFERCAEKQRRAEELPYHLEKILDNSRLLRSLVQWDVFSSLVVTAHGFDLMRYARVVGGYNVLATAIIEQLGLWRASGQLPFEELMLRMCVVAEFLTKAGLSNHAIALLRDVGTERPLKPTTEARRLGILADAILCSACFDSMNVTREYRSVIDLLHRGVSLWRSVPLEERDEASMAQALSNLCFQLNQMREARKAEEAGTEAVEIFSRIRHPRLAQAEQHMAHVYHSRGELQRALDMYRQSVSHFEIMGTAKFDTEYACSLASIASMLHEMGGEDPPWRRVLAWQRFAVVSCEAITGCDHAEAVFYRERLAMFLHLAGDRALGRRVIEGEDVAVTPDDMMAMRENV